MRPHKSPFGLRAYRPRYLRYIFNTLENLETIPSLLSPAFMFSLYRLPLSYSPRRYLPPEVFRREGFAFRPSSPNPRLHLQRVLHSEPHQLLSTRYVEKVAFFQGVGYFLFSDQNGPVPTDPGQCPWPLFFCTPYFDEHPSPAGDKERVVGGVRSGTSNPQFWSRLVDPEFHPIRPNASFSASARHSTLYSQLRRVRTHRFCGG